MAVDRDDRLAMDRDYLIITFFTCRGCQSFEQISIPGDRGEGRSIGKGIRSNIFWIYSFFVYLSRYTIDSAFPVLCTLLLFAGGGHGMEGSKDKRWTSVRLWHGVTIVIRTINR